MTFVRIPIKAHAIAVVVKPFCRIANSMLSTRCLPSLAAAPGFTPAAVASVVPTPRAFRCTCSAPGTWTEWAGVVSSSNFVLASQAARGQCANYLLNANAQSPLAETVSVSAPSESCTLAPGVRPLTVPPRV